ncbi:catechol 2,3-dioxygenase-like lactoylglutathione lyase family enzyme [Bacillus oleivorans]|uniref:Catechol 2,3-dioxygenase-like lactoylglutathione lyase family enzyme n=1 Tax=Bacillus oleivorans TaxID=1448271 RepID=A0A285CTL3_9BACI|nr:VOC family protein [Bacillus oleivorans]SNX70910.1 catechol 2,3-dioxygenase-like lactoylglutathione lyase family enzyme [Bacillus oleivorans]
MTFQFQTIDHVQLAAPNGCEERARKFYNGVLGFNEKEKPEELKRNGGVWFQAGSIEIHIGVEEPFSPAKKAHPAFVIDDLQIFIEHLEKNEIQYIKDNRLPGADRIYIFDPFGNRIEVLQWV